MKENEILKNIYPSVVTFAGDWKKMVKEVSDLKLTEISLFLTCAAYRERQEIYKVLEKTKVKNIPHVHIRHDMSERELDYLVSRFGSKVFSLHYQYFFKSFRNSKHRKRMFIESNNGVARIKSLSLLKEAGGVCIDLSHLKHFENHNREHFYITEKAVMKNKYYVGCNHLSAIMPNGKSWHKVKRLSELDYLKSIPAKYFSKYICLELGNPIKEQLKFRKYIAKLLATKPPKAKAFG